MGDLTDKNDTGSEMSPNTPRPGYSGSIGAFVLIAIGALLFLDNLGLLPSHARAYSPLGMSAWGVFLLTMRWSRFSVWPWTLIAVGILLTLGNLGVPHANMQTIWPIFIIAVGASMLFKRTGRCGIRTPMNFFAAHGRSSFFNRRLQVNALCSGVDRRIDSPNFEGADLNCTFGELKVDLRGATISTPNHEAIVETNASFGAIRLRVPETWKIIVQGTAVFGAYEDKTVPPRPVSGVDMPTLIIRGHASFGAVEIIN